MRRRPSRRPRPFLPMPPTALLAGVSEHSALLTDLCQPTMLQGYRDWALDELTDSLAARAGAVDARQRESGP